MSSWVGIAVSNVYTTRECVWVKGREDLWRIEKYGEIRKTL